MNLEENEVRNTSNKMGLVLRKFLVEKYASRCLTALQPIVQELVKLQTREISEDAKLAEQETEIKGCQKQLLEANEKIVKLQQEHEDYRQWIQDRFGKAMESFQSFQRDIQRPAQLPSSQRPAQLPAEISGTEELEMESLSDISGTEEQIVCLSDIGQDQENQCDNSEPENQHNQFYVCLICGVHLKDGRPRAIERHFQTRNCLNAKAAKQVRSRAGPRQGRRSRSGPRQGRSSSGPRQGRSRSGRR